MAQIELSGRKLKVKLEAYMDGGPRIQCYTLAGEPYCTATYNTGDLPSDTVAIKDYSESKGILSALVDAGAVEYTGQDIEIGYILLQVCKINREWFA